METSLTIRLDPELKAAAEAEAARRDESLSQVVRRALREYSGHQNQVDDPSGKFLERLSVMSAEAMRSSRFQVTSSIEDDPGIREILGGA